MTLKHYSLFTLFLLCACNSRKVEESVPRPRTLHRVTDRAGRNSGGVFILEYHRVLTQENSRKITHWDTSAKDLRSQLDRLYRLGFRPVSLTSYIEGKMELPPGASPVIFTFDDSSESQFRLQPDGQLDPECGVGILKAFAESHPDFPLRATFFILPPAGPFGPRKDSEKKLALLKQWSCELGSHTMTHRHLSRLSDDAVREELSQSISFIEAHGFKPESIALPFGISPRNVDLLKVHRAALLVGASPAPSPNDPARDLMRLPRIQATGGMNGVNYWLDLVERGRVQPYVEP